MKLLEICRGFCPPGELGGYMAIFFTMAAPGAVSQGIISFMLAGYVILGMERVFLHTPYVMLDTKPVISEGVFHSHHSIGRESAVKPANTPMNDIDGPRA